MLNHILRQTGLLAFGICLLASTAEIHSTYKLSVERENAKFELLQEAYQRSMDSALGHAGRILHEKREIDEVATLIDVRQLAPPQTFKKITAKAK